MATVIPMQSVVVAPRLARVRSAWRLFERPGPSLLEALFPSAGLRTKLAASAALVGLMAALAQARFYLPDSPVPVTLQTLGVLLTGGVLGWRWALLTVAAFYVLGMAGAPVFQGGAGGWSYVTGSVSGGYLLGFIVSAPVVSSFAQRGWHGSRVLWAMLAGSVLLYVPALLWLSVFDFGWPVEGELFSAGVYPYVPGDLLKLVLAALLVGAGWRLAGARGHSAKASDGRTCSGRLSGGGG